MLLGEQLSHVSNLTHSDFILKLNGISTGFSRDTLFETCQFSGVVCEPFHTFRGGVFFRPEILDSWYFQACLRACLVLVFSLNRQLQVYFMKVHGSDWGMKCGNYFASKSGRWLVFRLVKDCIVLFCLLWLGFIEVFQCVCNVIIIGQVWHRGQTKLLYHGFLGSLSFLMGVRENSHLWQIPKSTVTAPVCTNNNKEIPFLCLTLFIVCSSFMKGLILSSNPFFLLAFVCKTLCKLNLDSLFYCFG